MATLSTLYIYFRCYTKIMKINVKTEKKRELECDVNFICN